MHAQPDDTQPTRRPPTRRPKPRQPEVRTDQLRVRRGSLPIEPALDALADLLIDAWLEREARRGA